MVRGNRMLRAGKDFYVVRDRIKNNLCGLSDAQVTNGIARFLEQEGLTDVIIRREKRRRRGGLF